ncbi:hypothetical protein [Sporosarcina aquimarina]|uniref:hypothetical protein n=1 Tax=Sporosarcina aquimarina TaxID=114975 RepID=UPI00295EB882|nr:hypothetical protein [Sporosarcina aquimarina]
MELNVFIKYLKWGEYVLLAFILVILVVFLFDFAKIRKQNDTVIEQNEKIISLLEEIRNKQ